MTRRRVFYLFGGGPRIVYSIGVLWALLQMGVTYDFLVCVSTGALIPIFLEKGMSFEELLHYVIATFSRQSEFTLTNGLLFDAQAFVEQLEVKKSSAYVIATCNSTCQPKIFSLSKSSFLASMAIPGVTTHQAVDLDGRYFVDGSINALPIDELADQFGDIEIYLLQNNPNLNVRMNLSLEELYWGSRAIVRNPFSLLTAAFSRQERLLESIQKAHDYGIPLKIFCPDEQNIHSLENDATSLYSAANLAAQQTFERMGGKVLPFPKIH